MTVTKQTPVVRVAVVQAEVAPTLDGGLARTRELTEAAVTNGASLIVFPETWLPGYPIWLDVCRDVALWNHAPVKRVFARMAEQSVVVDGESGRAIAAIARDCNVTLVVGVTERVDVGVLARVVLRLRSKFTQLAGVVERNQERTVDGVEQDRVRHCYAP